MRSRRGFLFARQALLVIGGVVVLIGSTGCRSLESVDPDCAITELSLAPDTSSVTVGGIVVLQVTLRETGCDNVRIFWSSSHSTVASVSQSGVVEGLTAGGPATIAASVLGHSTTAIVRVLGRMAWVSVANPSAPLSAPASYNSSGLPVTVTRTGPGAYAIRFAGQGATGRSETIIASPLGTGSATCAVMGWGTSGPDIVATVACGSGAAARQDTPFTVLLLGSDMIGGRTAFARAHLAGATAPYAPLPAVSHNPSGKGITITRTATGRYDVEFTGNGRVAGSLGEAVLVSAFGDPSVVCQAEGWSTAKAIVSVRCSDALGTPRNAPFTVLVVEGGRRQARTGYTQVDCAGLAGCAVNPSLTYSTGGQVSATRLSAGVYRVVFAGLGRPAGAVDAVLVSPVSAASCRVSDWANAPNAGDLEVTVRCAGLGLSLSDAVFNLLVVE
jgi:hypothetical protein